MLNYTLDNSITSSTFVLIVVGVVWKVNGRPPNFDPTWSQNEWGIELSLELRDRDLGGLTKGAKCQICNHSGVVWAIGLNIHNLGLFIYFFTDFLLHALRSHDAPNMSSHARKCPFGVLLILYHFGGF